jgi:hypothetical protein
MISVVEPMRLLEFADLPLSSLDLKRQQKSGSGTV